MLNFPQFEPIQITINNFYFLLSRKIQRQLLGLLDHEQTYEKVSGLFDGKEIFTLLGILHLYLVSSKHRKQFNAISSPPSF